MNNCWKMTVALVLLLALVVGQSTAAATAKEELPPDSSDRSGLSGNAGTDEFSPGRLLVKMLLGLAAVLILLFLIGKAVAGRFGMPSGTARHLAVLDTLSLGPGKGVMIIKVGNKYFLMSIGGEHIHLLTELTTADLVPSSAQSPDFAAVLAQTQSARPNGWQQTVDAIRRQIWRLRRSEHSENEGEGK